MKYKCFEFLFLLSLFFGLSVAGHISIVGPRTVQHGKDYSFFLNSVDYDDEEVEIMMTGITNEDEVFSENFRLNTRYKNVTVELSTLKTIQNYTLTAKIAKENFEQTVEIFTIAKRFSVFIQTDKPVYKPGDVIKFRVLVIDYEMKPYKVEKLRVELIDPSENAVGDFEEEEENKLELGVIVQEFQIATEPVMGDWKLRVIAIDETTAAEDITTHKFEIKEYVLPRFEVLVDTKHDVTQGEGVVRLTVYGNYTFGEFVIGKAIITARTYDTAYPEIVHQTTSKTVDVQFKKLVEFNIKSELKIFNEIRPYLVKFEVEFEEGLTGQKMKKNAEVRVHKTGENYLKLVVTEKRFKPGFPFKVKAVVEKFDGSLSLDRHNPVKIKVNFFYKPPLCSLLTDNSIKNYEFHEGKFLKNGIAEFVLNVAENTTAMAISATYNDVTQNLNVKRHEARSREYLVLKSATSTPKIEKKVKIDIEGNGEWENLIVVVIGRTGIVFNKILEPTREQKESHKMNFEFVANKRMAPSAYVIVYYIQSLGEIVYDRIKIDLDSPLPNKLELKLSAETVKPGAKLTLDCKTTKNSFISLLGVDQSVTLLGSGNDIDKPRIASELNSYNAHKKYPELKIKGNKENRYTEFGESNAFILTNALDGEKTCYVDERIDLKISTDDTDASGLDFENDETGEAGEDRVRKNFPETWIFEDFEADDDGKYKLDLEAPDTITSFILTGFAVHPEKGLAVAGQKKVTVFQDFFLKLFLPYSVRLGEILKIDVTVFNYVTKPRRATSVTVEIKNDNGEFDFIDTKMVGNECVKTPSQDRQRSKTISVPSEGGASTFFLVKTLVTGEIKLKVKAKSPNRKDEVEKTILVEHEGLTMSGNIAKLFRPEHNYDAFHFNIPLIKEKLIPNSISMEASVIGDLVGPALQNIHSLIKKPTGCTEQQFVSWIPNIAAIKYLKSVGKLSDSFLVEGKRYLATGYQLMLSRRRPDGSYNFWGESGDASIWITAYMGKLLGYSKDYTLINDKYIVEALKYITDRQKPDGSFPEKVHNYYHMKSKTQQGVALTAFCVIALLENREYSQFQTHINKALNYINSKVATLDDNFAIAISVYALALNKHELTDSFLNQLKTNAISNDDQMFWYREAKTLSSYDSQSVNVEIAAYALMAFVESDRVAEAVPIMNWLMTKRNCFGGWDSSTETVVGLQALAKIATVLHAPNTNIEVKLSYERNRQKKFTINPQNAMSLQVEELEKDVRDINVNVIGTGFALVQVSYRYNTILDDPNERFELTAVPTLSGSVLTLKICANFIPEGDINQSQMTLVEVYLPSGFVYDPQSAEMVKAVGVRRVETERKKTIIVLYFDNFTSTKVCFNVQAIRENVVTDLKDSIVKIYNYYNKSHRASAFFSLKVDKFCTS